MKIGFIYSLINSGYLWTVIFMPAVARLGVMVMMYKTVTPRKNGMGNLFIGKASKSMFIIATIYTVVLISSVGKFVFAADYIMIVKIIGSIISVMIFGNLFKKHIYKKIDGVTGDILGCTIEISELLFLLHTYLLLSI